MRRIIVIITVLFLAVIATSILYFSRLGHPGSSKNRILTYIPADAAFLVSFQNDKSVYNIFQDYKVFEALIGSESQHELNFLHNQLLKGSDFAALSTKQPFYFSFHPDKQQINWLLTMPLGKEFESEEARQELQNLIEGEGELKEDTAANERIYKVTLAELKTPFYVTFKADAAMLSFNRSLLVRSASEKLPHLSSAFIEELQANNNKNSNAILNLHINHTELSHLISTLTRNKPGNNLQLLEGLKGMSSLNMNFKSDALMFSGLSNMEEHKETYLSLYSTQSAVNEELEEVLPANTSAYASFAFSNYADFHQQLKALLQKRKQLSSIQQQIRLIDQSKKVNIDSNLLSQWGNEFASIELNTRESIGIVKLKDSTSFSETINKLSSSVAEEIRRFDNSNLLYYSFGDPMLLFKRSYFTIVNHYLICANTISTLQQFRNNFYSKRLLVNSLDFLDFSKLKANKANISFFIHNQNISRYLDRLLKPVFLKSYSDTTHFKYQDFYGFSFQLSGYNGNFYSNLSAKFHLKKAEERKPLWVYNLSGTISYPPKVLKFNDSINFILTQDKANRLYAISEDGKEWWRATLSGQIMGNIIQLKDKSILLNTPDKLYRFKPDGTPLSGFPVLLPHQASFGLTIYDSDSSEIKMFIPAENRILAFDNNGKTLSDWKNKTVEGDILYDLKTTLLDGYNYIIAATNLGKFYLYNRNGSLVKVFENEQDIGFSNSFGIEITPGSPDQSRLLTSDTRGMLLSFYFDKKQGHTNLGSWTTDHYFNAVNIQKDSIPELIYLDKNQLYVYDSKDSTLLFNHQFDAETLAPLYFPTGNQRYLIGIPSAAKRLYVFDQDGSILSGFPLIGLPQFYYGKLSNDSHRYALLSKDGLTLAAYQMD